MSDWFKKQNPPGPDPHPSQALTPPSAIQRCSASGLELIEHFESFFGRAYQDSVGVWTYGWGAIVKADGTRVKRGDVIGKGEADTLLLTQVESEGAHYVRAYFSGLRLSQNQFDALTSFTYNRGAGRCHELALMGSEVARNLMAFDKAGDPPKVLPGLTRRRCAERAMFEGSDWTVFKDMATWHETASRRGYL